MLICVYARYIKRFYCIVYLILFSMPMYFYVVLFCLCFYYYWAILICLMYRIRGMLVAQVALCHLFEIKFLDTPVNGPCLPCQYCLPFFEAMHKLTHVYVTNTGIAEWIYLSLSQKLVTYCHFGELFWLHHVEETSKRCQTCRQFNRRAITNTTMTGFVQPGIFV